MTHQLSRLPLSRLVLAQLVVALGLPGCSRQVYDGQGNLLTGTVDDDDGDDDSSSSSGDDDWEDGSSSSGDDDWDDDTIEPTGACFSDLVPASFDFPDDGMSCDGRQYSRVVPEQGLWLGLVACGDGSMRFYLSESEAGPFYQATDWAGHGQDHCELVRPGFVLPNEDEITTGCAECSTGPNYPLEYVPAYGRGYAGEPFTFEPQTGTWSFQLSRIDCGCGL
jgi:hypothetical protein